MAISTNGTIITRLAGSLYGEYLSNASYTELNTTTASTVAANMLSNDFAGKTDAQIATTVLTNLSLTTVAGLDNWVAAQLTAAGSTAAAKGAKLVSMLNDYAMMTADATYGTSATSFNTKVAAGLVLSQTAGTAGGSFATAGTAPVSGGTFTLTTGADLGGINVGSNGGVASSFRFTSGNETISALTATTAGGDTLIDGSTTDADVLNLTATGAMTALTGINIETANVNFASGTTASAIFTNFSGLNTVNVTGIVAGTVEDAGTASIALDGYKRVLTVDIDSLAGTAAAATADVLNVSVSGTTYGSTAATRSGISVTIQSAADATDGTLETLNITSTGTDANNYSLAKDADTSFSVINLLGATEQTIRVEHDDVTGISIAGGAATGDVNVRVNREGDGTAATNVVNFTGVDNLVITDSATTPAAAMVLTGVASGQKITVAKDMATGSVITMAGTSRGVNAASLNVVLDNDTANRDTDIADLNIHDVTALNLVSNGYASTGTDASTVNGLTLVGDFTTITITGDTSINLAADIDGGGASEITARAVAITAAGMTGTASATISAAADTYVTYTITGTANDDTLTANASGNTLNGGAGNDTLTGGAKNDVMSGGDGVDTIYATAGTDTVTLGTGIDTVIFGEADVAAVRQFGDITPTGFDSGIIQISVNGRTYQEAFATNIATSITNFVTANATAILADTGVTVADGTTKLNFTGATAGTAFTLSGNFDDGGVTVVATVANAVVGVAGVAVDTRISDFTAGADGDVIAFDFSEMVAITGVADFVDSSNDLANTDEVEFISYVAGTALAAASIAATANLVKVAYSTAVTSAAALITLMTGAGITLDAATGGDTDSLLCMFYDADDGVMRLGYLQDTDSDAAGIFNESNSTFNEIAAVTMTGVQYTSLTAANFDIIA